MLMSTYTFLLPNKQEFKEDLGATGDKKTDEDKNDIQQRQDDKLGLKRDEKDAKRVEDSKK